MSDEDLTDQAIIDQAKELWQAILDKADRQAARIYELEAELRKTAVQVLLINSQERRIEELERDLLAITDTHDPVARGGHCIFCFQPIGLSISDPTRHADNCVWIARRALGDNHEMDM